MFFTVGSDVYGRVKEVGGTPVITRFVMVQHVPVFPLRSFYYLGESKAWRQRIPFVVTFSKTQIRAIPLERIDWLSVAITYLRGVCAILMIPMVAVAVMVLATSLTKAGPPLDETRMLFLKVVTVVGVAAIAIGAVSYYLPLLTAREERIRTHCGALLGMCIDPAQITADQARRLEEEVETMKGAALDERYLKLTRHLVIARARIAQDRDVDQMEARTDQILERMPPS